jgi:hypothetical protein
MIIYFFECACAEITQINAICSRFSISGRARVILYTKVAVKAGSLLKWNYNGLVSQGVPTRSYV